MDNLPKSKPAYDTLKSIIGKTSLVVIGGEHWKKLRKMFNPAFAPSHIETMIPAIIQESQVFVEKLSEFADTEKVVKMNQFTTVCYLTLVSDAENLTIDIIARVIFSIRLHTQKASTPMIDSLSRLIADVSTYTFVDIILRAINPLRYFARWRDERQCFPSKLSN